MRALAALTRMGMILSGALFFAALVADSLTLLPASSATGVMDPLAAIAAGFAVLAVIHILVERERAAEGLAALLEDRNPVLERRALAGLVILGFGLRFSGFQNYGLNPDEAQFVWFGAAETLADVWRYELTDSPHPPANFFLMHGILQLTWSAFWLRLPSVVAGSFVIWATHRFTRHLFGPAAALAAAFLVALAPALIDLSRVCRNYSPGSAVLGLALVFFAAFLRHERWRDYTLFALLAPLAILWHYGFAVALAGLDLVLAFVLLQRRRPVMTWLRVAALQLPLAALLVFLYVVHISNLEDSQLPLHRGFYLDMLGVSGLPLTRVADVWDYLMKQPAAALLLVLSAIAVLDLAIRSRWLELLTCTMPVAIAYALSLANLFPLGATRHSAYLFPFLFALAASQAPQMLDGYRTTRLALRRRRGIEADDTASARAGAPWPGALALALIALVVVHGSLDFYRNDSGWLIGGRGRELMRSYLQSDIDHAYALLEERFDEHDIVLLGFQGLYGLRMHLEMSPILDPDLLQRQKKGISLAHIEHAARHTHHGVRYFWSNKLGVAPGPHQIVRGVRDVRRRFRLAPPERVWLIQSAWEWPMSDRFDRLAPDVRYDRVIAKESKGMLFAVDFDELSKL